MRLFSADLEVCVEVREPERTEAENLDGVLEVEGARELLSSLPSDGWTVVPSRSLPEGRKILNARPEACVVIEDAPSRMRAARIAGMRVVALATAYPVEDLREADGVAPALAKIGVVRYPRSDGEPRFELSAPGCHGG